MLFFKVNIDQATLISISHYSDLVFWWPKIEGKLL